jgi:tetratricopeptide (TPR) repeat protein
MEEVWNSQYRGEIEATFVATGSAAARASVDTVAEAFDRYASAWSEARTAACRTGAALERDHGSEAERDLLRARLECLARKREHFVSLRDVLRTADREVIARAAFRAERLNAELGECSEARVAEESRTELTPARQAQADDILQGMQAAMELAYAGRLDESLDNTRRELERARGSGVASLIVKGLLLEGWIQESRGERASAIASTRDATWLAVEIGDAQHALDGAMDMILWAVEDGDVGVARQWEALARVVLARDGDDDLRWEVEYAGAFVDRLEERFDQALQRARWVWDDFVSRGRPHDSYALATALLLAEVQNLRGDTDDAMQWAQRAERMAMEMFGADHPWVADALHRQAVIHAGLGSPADALELHERALRLRLSVHPELHIKVVESRRDLAGVLRELGRIEEARGQLAKALGSCETILGASHVKCTQIGLALGTLALEQGRPQDAATRAQPPSPAGGTNASRK